MSFTPSILIAIGSAGIIWSCALLRYLYRSYGTKVDSTPYFHVKHFKWKLGLVSKFILRTILSCGLPRVQEHSAEEYFLANYDLISAQSQLCDDLTIDLMYVLLSLPMDWMPCDLFPMLI